MNAANGNRFNDSSAKQEENENNDSNSSEKANVVKVLECDIFTYKYTLDNGIKIHKIQR